MSSVTGLINADITEAFISASKYLDEIIYISNKLVIRSISLVLSYKANSLSWHFRTKLHQTLQ